jgi:hypothetical protein
MNDKEKFELSLKKLHSLSDACKGIYEGPLEALPYLVSLTHSYLDLANKYDKELGEELVSQIVEDFEEYKYDPARVSEVKM